jgi:predicted TPR repeat methyltransferase
VAESIPPSYFIELYKRESDPWHFETSEYERQKYAVTLQELPREHYEDALEIACSVGVFTNRLSQRCDRLLAIDVSDDALARARLNCANRANVRFERRTMPHDYPDSCFDLTTVCEMGFYLCMDDLLALRANVIKHSVRGAHVVLVHWTPPVHGHATTAQEVHEAFCAAPEFQWLHGVSAHTYRLDVLERR